MPTVPTIRQFRKTDLSRILTIEKEAFGRYAWCANLFEHYLKSDCTLFLIAKSGRAIAGYSLIRVEEGRAELDSLAVARHFRKRGTARRLLRFSIRKLRGQGITRLSLMVRRDNDAAIRLYRAFGFKRIRTVAGYYEDGATGWRMEVELTALRGD